MKCTILIKDGRTELVLEHESKHEEKVLDMLEWLPNTYRGQYYDCQGGWTRQGLGKDDLIIVFDKPLKQEGLNLIK